MNDRVRVGSADDFGPGERRIVECDGQEIGVLNVDGEYYAVENECAHMGGRVCKGRIGDALEAEFVEPGERVEEYFADEPAITCPLHGWEYDLETGVHLGDDDISIPVYDVVVEDGAVYVEL